MAAADLSRSRAAASRSTKSLFFISTLLCLLCFVSSSMDKDQLDQLKNLKQDYLTLKQELDQLEEKYMADSAMISEIMSEYVALMDQLTALVKKSNRLLPDGFPQGDTFMASISDFMKKTKAQLDDINEKLYRRMQDSEKKVASLQKLIEVIEEQQAEL